MNPKPKKHLRQQRGIAMIVALLALVLLAAIGMALMFMADTENSVNNNYKDSQKAYFAARAGAENVRLQLAPSGSLSAQALEVQDLHSRLEGPYHADMEMLLLEGLSIHLKVIQIDVGLGNLHFVERFRCGSRHRGRI